MAPPESYGQSPKGTAHVDPVLRNAIRYTISAKEYKTLHEYLLKNSPKVVRNRAPQPSKYDAAIKNKDDYNAAAVRASLRVFIAAQTGLKLWDIIMAQIARSGRLVGYKWAMIQDIRHDKLTSAQGKTECFREEVPKPPPICLNFPHSASPPSPPPFLHPLTRQSPHKRCCPVPEAKPTHFQSVDSPASASRWGKFGWLCVGGVSR